MNRECETQPALGIESGGRASSHACPSGRDLQAAVQRVIANQGGCDCRRQWQTFVTCGCGWLRGTVLERFNRSNKALHWEGERRVTDV